MAEMKKVQKISVLACTLLMLSGAASAAGLGKLSIQSALGQPLRAEIELLSVSKDELASISAKLASYESFRLARIDRPEALNNLRMSVDQRANGQPVVRISSTAAINDPFLDVLIELSWSSGRIIREYTLLLDPPGQGKLATESVNLPTEAATRAPVAATATEAAKPAPVESAPAAAKPAPGRAAGDRYGPVKSGETLRAIAGQLKPAQLSVEQMMVALYQGNKGAFFDGNMNNLKKGAVLDVPAEASVAAVDRASAQRTLGEHLTAWHAYRSKVADDVAAAPAGKSPESAAGKITPKAAEVAPPAAGASKDVLKLSKGEPAAASAKALEKQRALEEELAAKNRSLQEAQNRVAQLEKTVSDMQKLMDMKAKAPPAPAPAPVPAPAPKPAAQTPAPAPVAAPPSAAPAPAPAPVPSAAAKPAVEAKPPVSVPGPALEPATQDKGWLSTFITDPLYVGGLVAALLLSALLWMMMVGSRRRQGLNKFEDSIMTGGEFKNASVFNAPTGVGTGATTGGSMLLTDFSRLGLGAIDTHEVDPIAEAEVYMAYGRDAQAEEILKEALAKDPTRHEIALKLLEIFAARKDTVAFETAASELYAGLGGQNTPVWQRAAEMGRSIDPTNPLYRLTTGDLGASTQLAATSEPAVAEPAEMPMPVEAAAPVEASAAEGGATVVGLEESFPDLPTELAAAPEMVETAQDFMAESELPDFATPSLSEHDVAPTPEPVMTLAMEEEEVTTEEFEPVAAEELPEVDLSDIDLDLAEPEVASEPVSFAESTAPGEAEDVALEFEPMTAEPEAVAEFIPDEVVEEIPAVVEAEEVAEPVDFSDEPSNLWEEVNTKLDLARAYLEMGDKEGAREILQEVLGEGDADQKGEAEKLLAEAG
jgi:pilus assembly protein FimV